MMSEPTFVLVFPDVSAAEANQRADSLSSHLRGLDRHLQVEQRRDRDHTQDLGATVAVVLGTASVVAVAKGIAAWLARHSGATIQILVDGSIVATNLDSKDAARIAEAFSRPK